MKKMECAHSVSFSVSSCPPGILRPPLIIKANLGIPENP